MRFSNISIKIDRKNTCILEKKPVFQAFLLALMVNLIEDTAIVLY